MKRIRSLLRAGTFSPTGLCVWAGAVTVAFALVHLAGWREQVTVLSGTLPPGGSFAAAQFKAATYLATYFGTVVGAPILLVAAALLKVWMRRSGGFPATETGRLESRPSMTQPITRETAQSP